MSDFVEVIKTGKIELSSNNMIKSVVCSDTTVELIGIVESMTGPKLVGKTNKFRLLKFILSNKNGCRILTKVWNEQIPRVLGLIRPNNVLHIDAASAKTFKSSNFNEGNVPYELSIQSNTVVTLIRNENIEETFCAENVPVYNFEDLGKVEPSELIRIEGYLKTNIQETSEKGTKILVASITDGNHKLEIRIFSFNDFEKGVFEKGEKLAVIGRMVFEKPVYFKVDSLNGFKKIEDEKMDQSTLNKGTKRIYQELNDSDHDKNAKIAKF